MTSTIFVFSPAFQDIGDCSYHIGPAIPLRVSADVGLVATDNHSTYIDLGAGDLEMILLRRRNGRIGGKGLHCGRHSSSVVDSGIQERGGVTHPQNQPHSARTENGNTYRYF